MPCASTPSTRWTSASPAPTPPRSPAATRRRNADCIRSVLAGDKGAARDIAVLNAAAAVVVAGIAPDFGAGVEVAAEALDSGRAAGALDALVRVSADALVRENDGS